MWGDDPDTIHDLAVPCTFDGIPYEILIRLRANDGGDMARPGFLGLQFEGNFISGNMPTVSGQGEWDGESRRWSGDILIDLPGALAEDMAASPEPLSITSAEQISDKPLLSEQERAVDAFDAAAEEPVSDEDDENTLVVRVTYEDVSRPEFIAELRQLRDFIHARTGDPESGHYDRLGLDVRKWHKMRVAGPTGADVDLDPELPDLAPTGGLDNTRALKSLRLPNGDDKYMGEVRVTEVPPGALLTHGKNLGDGVWQLSTEEARLAAVLPAIADTTTSVIRVSTSDQDNGGEVLRKSLVGSGNFV